MSSRAIRVLAVLLVAAPLAAWAAVTDIDKFGWVSDNVATGGQPTIPQITSLAREKFQTIINLREPSEHDATAEEVAAKRAGLRYVNIPVKREDPKREQVAEFLRVTADPRIFPVYIHCSSGNRVGAFWMIRRVLVDGWTIEDAELQAKVIGLANPSMKEFALAYIREHQRKK